MATVFDPSSYSPLDMVKRYPLPEDPAVLQHLRECEVVLGYTFQHPELLALALTHRSASYETRMDNERLEFFGDAILDFVVCEEIFRRYPEHEEGELTEIKSAVVQKRSLAAMAQRLGLASWIRVGRGVPTRHSIPASILANTVEALIAAVYLDGGLEAARTFILSHLHPAIEEALASAGQENYKSILQERLQQQDQTAPEYEVVEEYGPDHAKEFVVVVMHQGVILGRGRGRSKKEAQQDAARNALERLDESRGEERERNA